ncbi:hypothetical protein CJ204_02550 [Corynebacterium xerosis]|uniref:Uncharacterized protein n=1 Tax=Corynebacterium xerosis TaxID=1725 RepID=A0A2N6T0U1_9CORY|nr:hypothetical protein [Corynebacterium xerosis]PMC62938.1 hypothetical protein CJ204_02550 [Corynebacterium xerosis]
MVAVAGFAMTIWFFGEVLVYPEYNTLQPVYGAVGLFQIGLLLALLGVSSVGRELRLRFSFA